MISQVVFFSLFGASLCCLSASAATDNYPNKPIRMVTQEAGGSADLAARVVAAGLSGSLGQQVIVDNRGGSIVIPTQIVAKAPPDGYTLYGATTAAWILPLLQDHVAYDPIKDFAPVSLTTTSPSVLAVHPSVAANTVKEFITLAKARPGALSIGSGTRGSTTYLAAELFKAVGGIKLLSVPYKGGGPAIAALIGGQIHAMFPSASSAMPLFKSGRLRVLAVASAQPSPLAPGVPTMATAGLPGCESGVVNGVFAPASTPDLIVQKLNREIIQFLNKADTREKLLGVGMEAVASSPQEFAYKVKFEMAKWGKLFKEASIRGD